MGLRDLRKVSRVFKSNNGDGIKLLKSSSMTRRGYVSVCVGVNEETKRFMVHRNSLRDMEFTELLCRSAEEYGFQNQGVLRIAYDANDFEDWMVRWQKRKILRVSSA